MQEAILELSELTDHQLLDLVRRGDQEVFGELVQRHWRKCVDVGLYYLRNRSDAEDQAQNAFLKAYERLDQYQGQAEFSTWLARIVANECLMLMRVRRRVRFVYLDEAPSEPKVLPLELPAPDADPEGELSFRQLTEILRSELSRVPPLMRNVMMLRDIEGLGIADVARQLGITVPAAKSRLVRARAEMRVRVTRHYSHLNSSPLSRTAAPLNRVGRRFAMQRAF